LPLEVPDEHLGVASGEELAPSGCSASAASVMFMITLDWFLARHSSSSSSSFASIGASR
jgi:hypothetical protein